MRRSAFALVQPFIGLILLQLAGTIHAAPITTVPDDANTVPYWKVWMQDRNVNFFLVKEAATKYWKDRRRQKGDGFKPYKRWEYRMRNKVNPDGTYPPPDRVLKEIRAYVARNPRGITASSTGSWSELGPRTVPINNVAEPNGAGRLNAIAFHPSNKDILYVGAPSGGFWITTNSGVDWFTTTDTLPTLGVSAIAVSPGDPSVIYIGTGDRDAGDAPGLGVWRSSNGGFTWTPMTNTMGNQTVNAILINPTNAGILLAATSDGIYRSTNAGTNWTRTSTVGNFTDMEFRPTDPNVVYATARGKFYRSLNNGDTWVKITQGVPAAASRLALGVSLTNTNYVYFISDIVFDGIYRSTDGGAQFAQRVMSSRKNLLGYETDGSDDSAQAYYDLCLLVERTNANVVYVGAINIWKTTDGGTTFNIDAHWWGDGADAVHADQHALEYNPADDALYGGNDGGLYRVASGGTTWSEIGKGLSIAQVYKIGQSATVRDLVMNGYQDNGTAIMKGTNFYTVISADGMECIVDYSNTNYLYGCLYNGYLSRSTNGGVSFKEIAGMRINGITEEGDWVTPYCLHESNPDVMFIGYKSLWRSTNVRVRVPQWTRIWGDSTKADMTVVEHSPADTNLFYCIQGGATFWHSDNVNADMPSWTNLSSRLAGAGPVTDLEAHPSDPNTLYMTRGTDVYLSTNKGLDWTIHSGTLPQIPLNCILYDKITRYLYVGTDSGAFQRGPVASDWTYFDTGLPEADVRELEIYYAAGRHADSRIRAATYGRGLWEAPPSGLNDLVTLYTYAQGPGSISPSGSNDFWRGSNVSVLATASNYYQFSRWEGGTNGSQNPITVAMDSARTVTAVFVATVVTNDVPQWWLAQYGLPTNNAGALYEDGDGMPAWQEYVAGTDPTNAASVFRFTSIDGAEGQGLVIRWPSRSNRFYNLSRTTNLMTGTNAFAILPDASNMPATPTENHYTDSVQGVGPYFYKIDVHE